MSWLTDLAGRAENLLNKIDQNAAVVLKDKTLISDQLSDVIWSGSSSSSRRGSLSCQEPLTLSLVTSGNSSFVSPPRLPRAVPSGAPSPALRSSPARSDITSTKKSEDDDLLHFLNNPERMTPGFEDIRRSPSGASIPSAGSCSPVNIVEEGNVGHSRTHSRSLSQASVVSSRSNSVRDDPISHHCFKPVEAMDYDSQRDIALANVMAENDLLKNEVRSLNNEISLLLHRTKVAEKDARVASEQSHSLQEVRALYQQVQNQLKTLENELRESRQQYDVLSEENLRLKKREEEQQQSDKTPSEFASLLERCEQMQAERDRYAEESRELGLQVSHLQAEAKEAATLSERHWQQLATVTSEAEQYRARATRVLQDKERLIAKLQAGSSADGAEQNSALEQEVQQLRREHELLQAEIANKEDKLKAAREELQNLESRYEEGRHRSDTEIQRLQDRIQEERARRISAEDDYRMQTEELRVVRHKLNQQRDLLASRARETEAELLRVRQQSSPSQAASSANGSSGELETRIRHLATALMQKQSALEALIAERNALRLQLERSEKQTLPKEISQNGSTVLSLNDNENAMRSRVPTLLTESPTDTGVARRVKRAYSNLDTLGIRVGVFLRRYPLARILVILYMVILHLWVALVLFNYSPDAQPAASVLTVPEGY